MTTSTKPVSLRLSTQITDAIEEISDLTGRTKTEIIQTYLEVALLRKELTVNGFTDRRQEAMALSIASKPAPNIL